MSFLQSTAQLVNNNNRNLQRKGRAVFTHQCLPVMSKSTKAILTPVAPEKAHAFRARLASDRKRDQMAVGLLLIVILGLSAAVLLAIGGMF